MAEAGKGGGRPVSKHWGVFFLEADVTRTIIWEYLRVPPFLGDVQYEGAGGSKDHAEDPIASEALLRFCWVPGLQGA